MRNADCIGELDLNAIRKPRRDDVLRDVARRIRRAAVHLRGILARERTAAVTCPATVGIDDDLASRESGVAVRSADNELARRVDEILCLCAQKLCRNDLLDDLLDHILADGREVDILIVLRRDNDGIDVDGFAVLVGNRDLRLAVGTQIFEIAVLAHIRETARELMREHGRERHVLGRFVRRIAEHHALIACTDRLCRVHIALAGLDRLIDALRNIRRLLVKRDEDAAGVGIEAVAGVRITDITHRLADDLRNIDVAGGRDLTDDVRLSRRNEGLTRNTPLRILREDSVENAVRDLIGEFVGMTLGDRLGCKEHLLHLEPPLVRKNRWIRITSLRKPPLRQGRLELPLSSHRRSPIGIGTVDAYVMVAAASSGHSLHCSG